MASIFPWRDIVTWDWLIVISKFTEKYIPLFISKFTEKNPLIPKVIPGSSTETLDKLPFLKPITHYESNHWLTFCNQGLTEDILEKLLADES